MNSKAWLGMHVHHAAHHEIFVAKVELPHGLQCIAVDVCYRCSAEADVLHRWAGVEVGCVQPCCRADEHGCCVARPGDQVGERRWYVVGGSAEECRRGAAVLPGCRGGLGRYLGAFQTPALMYPALCTPLPLPCDLYAGTLETRGKQRCVERGK